MPTHNHFDLETLGSQLIMPKNIPWHWALQARKYGIIIYEHTSHPSKCESLTLIGLLLIHLKWPRVGWFGVFQANSDVSLTCLNEPQGCILYQGFCVGWMRDMLGYNKSFSLCHAPPTRHYLVTHRVPRGSMSTYGKRELSHMSVALIIWHF